MLRAPTACPGSLSHKNVLQAQAEAGQSARRTLDAGNLAWESESHPWLLLILHPACVLVSSETLRPGLALLGAYWDGTKGIG